MPLPHAVARFNRRVTDRFLRPVVSLAPGYALVHHVGRRSGRAHSTPVVVFDLGATPVVALTYGTRADWFRNVSAGGPSALERDGRTRGIDTIDVIDRSAARAALPGPVRLALRLLRVDELARMTLREA